MNEQINYENNIPEVSVDIYDAEPVNFEYEDERKGFPLIKLIICGGAVVGGAVVAGKVAVPKIKAVLKKKAEKKAIRDLEKVGYTVIPPEEVDGDECVEYSDVDEKQ